MLQNATNITKNETGEFWACWLLLAAAGCWLGWLGWLAGLTGLAGWFSLHPGSPSRVLGWTLKRSFPEILTENCCLGILYRCNCFLIPIIQIGYILLLFPIPIKAFMEDPLLPCSRGPHLGTSTNGTYVCVPMFVWSLAL